MGIREEIEELRKSIPKNLHAPMPNGTKAPSLSYYLVYNGAIKEVLSILDEWELVAEKKIDERLKLILIKEFEGFGLLSDSLFTGDHIIIYRRKKR